MYGPVSDWATDIDHTDPQYNPNAPDVWKELRDGGCPVAHTERYGGMWAPITHELVNEVAYDTEHFTSRGVVVNTGRPDVPPPVGPAPPITSDPPFHNLARRLLLPPFAPKKIEPWEPEIRRLCNKLLDAMGDIEPGETVIDAALQYAQHIPVNVIGRMLGFPEEDEALFREFVHNTLELINEPVDVCEQALEKLDECLDEQIADHLENPRDDLTTYMLNAELDGMPLEPDHVRGSIVLLLIAGIDTTWSAIGSSLWHLAQHPADRKRLGDDPDVMVFALEEFLRSYAPVTMARLVAKDHDFHGCPMKEDDWVLLPFPAANRDPRVFEDADTFVIDRRENRHAAFGLGIHRCLGSNLARLELKVAIEEFVARFPDFELACDTTWSVGQIRGPRTLPVRVIQTAG
jgi:cytochrome P450